jgi:hypothetical protein
VGIKTSIKLGRNKVLGKSGNKTQTIVFNLLEYFPKKKYYYFMNNLFISKKFLEFLQIQDYNAIDICRINTGVITELIDLKKKIKEINSYRELFGRY